MTALRRLAPLALACAASAAAAGVLGIGARSVPGFDYRTVPPPHAETEAILRGAPVGLARAVGIAEEATKGVARDARFAITDDGNVWVVRVHHGGIAERLVVDAGSGEVIEREDVPRLPGWLLETDEAEPTVLGSGVAYHELVTGEGEPIPSDTSNVRIEYTGYLLDGTIFDATERIGRPVTLPISSFLAGWSEGMRSMRVGGRRKLIIPPELAFGGVGSPPSIPPNATLVIDVELLKVVDYQSLPETLPGWAVDGAPQTSDSGLRWWDVVEGTGDAPADLDTIVELHYVGWLTDGTEIATTMWDQGAEGAANVSLRRVIGGWQEAILGMKVGGRRKVVVPYELGYGGRGSRGVPPRATLIYDLELVGIVNN